MPSIAVVMSGIVRFTQFKDPCLAPSALREYAREIPAGHPQTKLFRQRLTQGLFQTQRPARRPGARKCLCPQKGSHLRHLALMGLPILKLKDTPNAL